MQMKGNLSVCNKAFIENTFINVSNIEDTPVICYIYLNIHKFCLYFLFHTSLL